MSIKNFLKCNQPLIQESDEDVEMVRYSVRASGQVISRSVTKKIEFEWQNQLLRVENLNMREILTKIMPQVWNAKHNGNDSVHSYIS